MTIQIDLVKLLSNVSAILAILWAIVLMKNRLKRLKPIVLVIFISLLGVLTTMWLIGITMPNDNSKFMWYVVLLVTHFMGFTVSMTAMTKQCNGKD